MLETWGTLVVTWLLSAVASVVMLVVLCGAGGAEVTPLALVDVVPCASEVAT